jgi:hypothetical protein
MKALIIQTMLALLIPGLTDTPKQALTPPTTFDYSYKLQTPTGYPDPIWHFKNESTGSYSTIYYTRSSASLIGHNYDTGYLNLVGFTDIEWRLQFFQSNASMFLVGDTYYQPWYNSISTNTTSGQSARKFLFQFGNLSEYNYDIYLDFSSSNSSYVFTTYYSALSTPSLPYTLIYNISTTGGNIANNRIRIPAFTSLGIFYDNPSGPSFDAIYFRKLPLSQGMGGYGQSNYNEGYTAAYDEFGNFDWLSSLFTTMGDLLAIEILPGITIGLILLIPIVFGVLRFIMGLFR